MAEALYPHRLVSFGNFEVDLQSGELRKAGMRLKLTGQPFQVLAILLEHPGEVVTREELQKRLWPDTFVDVDHNLNTAINKIREVLGDSAETPSFVETLPRRGYRFIGSVQGQVQETIGVMPGANVKTTIRDSEVKKDKLSSGLRKWWLMGLILMAACVLTTVGLYFFAPSRRPPRVLAYRQLIKGSPTEGRDLPLQLKSSDRWSTHLFF